MCTNSRNKFKRHYLRNKKLFVVFLLDFWNVHEIQNILKTKISMVAELFQKLLTPKQLVT